MYYLPSKIDEDESIKELGKNEHKSLKTAAKGGW